MKPIAEFPTKSCSTLPPDSYSFDYTVGITLWLTRADIDLLILCSRHHYDTTCQSFGLKRDESSLLGGWAASENGKLAILRDAYLSTDGERTPAHLTQREIDTMLKILEVLSWLLTASAGEAIDPDHARNLSRRLREAFHGINREYFRLRETVKDQAFST